MGDNEKSKNHIIEVTTDYDRSLDFEYRNDNTDCNYVLSS